MEFGARRKPRGQASRRGPEAGAGTQDVWLGHRRERKRKGPRWLKGFGPLKLRTVKPLLEVGNTEGEVDLGYVDELFWVCILFMWRGLICTYKCGPEVKNV